LADVAPHVEQLRRGMTRDSIPAGTEVVVFGYRHRNGCG
jgi:hypothetical protein